MSLSPGAPDAAAQISGLVFAVLLVDDKDRIVEANPAAEELLGRSARRLEEMSLHEAVAIEDERLREGLGKSDSRVIARGISLETGVGTRRVNLTSSPMQAHPGWRVISLSEVGQEGNDRGDEERVELRAPAVLAHEIKNPLSAIRGASQLLARRASERDRPLATMIEGEVDRIAQLIDRMQQLGSSSPVKTGPCNLHEAIRNAMATVRAGRDDGCELVEEFDPSLPAVEADQGALEQVLINLLANACDACCDVENAQVIVRTRFVSGLVFSAIRLGKAVRMPIEITVIDPGPGLPPDLHDHAFEPFVSGKKNGQGLGLALVRKLLRDMGGRIAHERDERGGLTHFRINLPVADRNES
ncbi:two-component system sensor histidine kinase NtrB [Qipengyuania vesicularis]|uniref:two-component system sensor histidine kinase NtrB n=1 Tax=Qipengyuania vesicularis TaxID=2867232 RepID=UPI001C87B4EF|nr:ATP-binding protein [Qipengyuania vesicularis]MBX7526825.1 PAS domain-containing protein [Qipengyuania vesicularis]